MTSHAIKKVLISCISWNLYRKIEYYGHIYYKGAIFSEMKLEFFSTFVNTSSLDMQIIGLTNGKTIADFIGRTNVFVSFLYYLFFFSLLLIFNMKIFVQVIYNFLPPFLACQLFHSLTMILSMPEYHKLMSTMPL